MLIPEPSTHCLSQIAKAADLVNKPMIHSVICKNDFPDINYLENNQYDLILLIECRNPQGIRVPEEDIEVEIYPSGDEINLTLSFKNISNMPILWQGKYSFWMESESGKRCNTPNEGIKLESFARKLRAIFTI